MAGGVNIVQLRARVAAGRPGPVRRGDAAARDDGGQGAVRGDGRPGAGREVPRRRHPAAGALLQALEARAFLRGDDGGLVGAFARSVPGAGRAERGGADYVQVGPAFDPDAPADGDAGLVLLRKVKDAVHIPVIAFGGIRTPEQVGGCIRAGADGVALTDAITRAPDPQSAATALRAALDAAWSALHDGQAVDGTAPSVCYDGGRCIFSRNRMTSLKIRSSAALWAGVFLAFSSWPGALPASAAKKHHPPQVPRRGAGRAPGPAGGQRKGRLARAPGEGAGPAPPEAPGPEAARRSACSKFHVQHVAARNAQQRHAAHLAKLAALARRHHQKVAQTSGATRRASGRAQSRPRRHTPGAWRRSSRPTTPA